MFKYDQFPILKVQVYNSEGTIYNKKFRLKSHEPYTKTTCYSLINVIDLETSQHMTLKRIFKTKQLSKNNTLAEIYNQQKMKYNSNFLQIKQFYEDHQNIYILMEQIQTNLQLILQNRQLLLQRQVQFIFCQLVTILQSLRRNNIFHGGITLNNLYIDKVTMKLKLSGFQHSINMQKTNLDNNTHTNLYSYEQISPYIAPQLFDNSIQNPYVYYAADIWSVGVVLYTLLIGQQPFTNIQQANKKQIKSPSIMKIKNYLYQFPKVQLQLKSPYNKTNLYTEQHMNLQTQNSIGSDQILPMANNSSIKINRMNSNRNQMHKLGNKFFRVSSNKIQKLSNLQLSQLQNPKQKQRSQIKKRPCVSRVWKELLKKIFVCKQKRIQLPELIQHPLNMITQSQFSGLPLGKSDKISSSIRNHLVDSADLHLTNIKFQPKKQSRSFLQAYAQNQKSLKSQSIGINNQNKLINKNVFTEGTFRNIRNNMENYNNNVTISNTNRLMNWSNSNLTNPEYQKLSNPPCLLYQANQYTTSSNLIQTANNQSDINYNVCMDKNREQLTGGPQNTLVLCLILQQNYSLQRLKDKYNRPVQPRQRIREKDKQKSVSSIQQYAPTPKMKSTLSLFPQKQKQATTQLHRDIEQRFNKHQNLVGTSNFQPIPLISRRPKFIQKYCYIKKYDCVGYILDNVIGVIFADGSSMVGKNSHQYKYRSNDPTSIDDLMHIYCNLFDLYCITQCSNKNCHCKYDKTINHTQSSSQGPNNESSSMRRQRHKDTMKNDDRINQGKKSSYSNSYDSNNASYNNFSAINSNLLNSKIVDNNSIVSNTNINTCNNININTINNINPNGGNFQNMSCMMSNSRMSSKSKNKRNKMIQINNPNNISSNINKQAYRNNSNTYNESNNSKFSYHRKNGSRVNIGAYTNKNITQADNNLNIIKFGESFYSFSFNHLNQNANQEALNQENPNSSDKFNIHNDKNKDQIYKFFVNYFGDRVIQTNYKESQYIVSFWIIKSAFVFLYSTGTWQINFTLKTNTAQSSGNKQYDNELEKNMISSENGNGMKRSTRESALLIDKYGLAWWLDGRSKNKQIPIITSSNETNRVLNPTGLISAIDFSILQNISMDMNKQLCINSHIKSTNNYQKNRNKKNDSQGKYIDEGYNSLCVKIGRKIVSAIKQQYIGQFMDIMEPYKYNRQCKQ